MAGSPQQNLPSYTGPGPQPRDCDSPAPIQAVPAYRKANGRYNPLVPNPRGIPLTDSCQGQKLLQKYLGCGNHLLPERSNQTQFEGSWQRAACRVVIERLGVCFITVTL